MTETPKRPDYPFEEFSKHFDEISLLLKTVYKDEGPDLLKSLLHVRDYFATRYEDEKERQYKLLCYSQIMFYLSNRLGDFDTEDFAVTGSTRLGGLVQDHLLQAIHYAFTEQGSLSDMPDPKVVMEIAERFRESPGRPKHM